MATISLKIDVIQGTMELECSAENFESVISSAERVLGKFANVKTKVANTGPPSKASPECTDELAAGVDDEDVSPKQKSKTRRKKGGGHANWKVVENLLTEEQRRQLKEFYDAKAPGKQNDQVAVLAYKLTEMLDRDGFDGHEIHTAFQAVGQKTPANLTGVFGNMTGEDLGKMVEKKWTPNFKSSDRVKHDLPAKSKK